MTEQSEEKKSKTSRYLVWLKQAQFDLEIAKISLDNKFYEWATYQAGQSVEKSLKAVIVQAGEAPPRMHKLSVLMGYCNSLNHVFKETKINFRQLDSFAFISRYPFLIPGKNKAPHELITSSEAALTIEQAKTIVMQVEHILGTPVIRIRENEEGLKPVSREELEQRLDEIKNILIQEFNPEKIVLFGSYSRDPLPKILSTIDLCVLAQTDMGFLDRIKKARELTKGGIPSVEALIYTPEEFRIMTEEEGESFLEEAIKEGEIIYKKTAS